VDVGFAPGEFLHRAVELTHEDFPALLHGSIR
jgi:hypothetical protein